MGIVERHIAEAEDRRTNQATQGRRRLVNQIKKLAEQVLSLPSVARSTDPFDDYLLALSEAGQADYLVTGDKSGLLVLKTHGSTRILSAREFAVLLT